MADDDSPLDGTSDLDREWQELARGDDAPREDARGGATFTGADRPAYWEDSAAARRTGGTGRAGQAGAGSGPRDWSAPIEEDHFDGVDPDVVAFYNQPPAPSHPLALWMWGGAFASAIFALLFWFHWLPGGALATGTALALMIALAAVGVFLTAPRDDNVDPTDDGTRL